jgi:cytochrome c biogenesis protein CcmG/thiol:disulfide interchange protein DsbE
MKKPGSLLNLSTVALLMLSACPFVTAGDATPANLRKAAPDFTLADSKGASIRLSDYKGKVVLLDFWATWCHGCKTEIPWYMEFQQKYRDKGLAVIGVAMDEDGWKSVKPYIEETKINYTIVVGNEELAKKYGADSLPVTLLIDRDGKIAESHAGMVDKAAFEKDVQTIVGPAEKAQP